MTDHFPDLLSIPVHVGDFVAYGTRSGNVGATIVARVEKIEWRTVERYDYATRTRLPVQVPRVGVRPFTGTRFSRPTGTRISYPTVDNMIRIEPPTRYLADHPLPALP